MPSEPIGCILSDVLFTPKYARCVNEVPVAIDGLGNMWICLLSLGTSVPNLVHEVRCAHLGLQRPKGHHMDYDARPMVGSTM